MLQTAKIVMEPAGGAHNLNPGEYYFDSETNTIFLRRGGASSARLGPKTITANGVYYPAGDNLDGFNSVDVQVPGITPTGTVQITENGTYNVTQYASAEVNVSGGGGSSDKILISRTLGGNTPSNPGYDTQTNAGDGYPDICILYVTSYETDKESLPISGYNDTQVISISPTQEGEFVGELFPNSALSSMAQDRAYIYDAGLLFIDPVDHTKARIKGTCLINNGIEWGLHYFGGDVNITQYDNNTTHIHGYKIEFLTSNFYIDGSASTLRPVLLSYQYMGLAPETYLLTQYEAKFFLKQKT